VIATETPQLGRVTYLFSRPQSIEAFLAAYAGTTREVSARIVPMWQKAGIPGACRSWLYSEDLAALSEINV